MVPLANSQDAAIAGGGLSPERAAAVAYANQWALGRNPEYDNHGDADCTNFVSQCLRAGSTTIFCETIRHRARPVARRNRPAPSIRQLRRPTRWRSVMPV
ncbi:amidase domain-containing protein [Nocardia nova]|nr:amidase domain-containing protein [Nocardia nova]